MNQEAKRKNTDLEVLRAVAISFTLAEHLVIGILPKLGSVGGRIYDRIQFWTGVDLFFAISGFIITSSLLHELLREPAGGDTFGDKWRRFKAVAVPFWIRRAFRLLPTAWLWMGIVLLLAAAFNAHDSFGTLRNNGSAALAAVLDFANFHYYRWFAQGHMTIASLAVYWSLSLEEQFYLVLPFLLLLVPWRKLVPFLAAAFLAQAFIPRPNGFAPHPTVWWFVRTDAIILGVLIAFWHGTWGYRQVEEFCRRHRGLTTAAVVLGVVALCAKPSAPWIESCDTGIVAAVSGILVLVASFDSDFVFPASKFKDALVWLGGRSYSIYLIHIPIRALILEIKLRNGVHEGSTAAAVLSVASVAVALLAAELNYRIVETPLRAAGRRIAAKVAGRASARPVILAPPAALAVRR